MTAAILVAGGAGTRLGGGTPKAFRALCGKPLVAYALDTIRRCDSVDSVVMVVPADYISPAQTLAASGGHAKPLTVVAGGTHRQDSVRAGLEATSDDCQWVAVHDAARPFATAELFADVIAAAKDHGGAIAARRAADTLKLADRNRIAETLDRDKVWLAETPQVFRRTDLIAALSWADSHDRIATDEAQLVEWQGLSPHLVETTGTNLKITTPADWALAEQVLRSHAS